jgi:DDE superfamily endonuclease
VSNSVPLPELPSDALVGVQESGYFIGENFLRVLQHIDQYAVSARPLLFIVDGCKGHIDLTAIDYARSKQINLLCLPSQTTHILQVADVALFGPFKRYWAAACNELKRDRARRDAGKERGIRRADIVPLVLRSWQLSMTEENVIHCWLQKDGHLSMRPYSIQSD